MSATAIRAFPRTSLTMLRVGHCSHPECLALRGGAWRTGVFPALVGLIRHPDAGAFLFDTGYAEHFTRATARLPEKLYRWTTPVTLPDNECLQPQLARHGIAMHEVRGVFASHLHADHIAGLRDLPRAAIWCSDIALRSARAMGRISRLRKATLLDLLPDDFDSRHRSIEALPMRGLPHAWQELGEGHDLLGDGSLYAVPLPGHARGQYGLLLRHENDREFLLAGDATWRIDRDGHASASAWPTRFLADDWRAQGETLSKLQRVLDGIDDSRCVLPSHCADSYARLPQAIRGTP
ncbi:MAG: MBL fold metallo-hydrolase [Xanthomonadales bacterium]|nr:MBL fold metallo-hydrolase [Xanthomonadales bacterium]